MVLVDVYTYNYVYGMYNAFVHPIERPIKYTSFDNSRREITKVLLVTKTHLDNSVDIA